MSGQKVSVVEKMGGVGDMAANFIFQTMVMSSSRSTPTRRDHVRDAGDVLRRAADYRDPAQKAARCKTEPLAVWRQKRGGSALGAGNRLPVYVVSTAQVNAIPVDRRVT